MTNSAIGGLFGAAVGVTLAGIGTKLAVDVYSDAANQIRRKRRVIRRRRKRR